MPNFIDMTGRIYGRWTVIRRTRSYVGPNSNGGQWYWLCRCSCPKGTEREVLGTTLRSGGSSCCGCTTWEKNKGQTRNLPLRVTPINRVHQILFGSYKDGARVRDITWHLTRDEFWALTQQNCYYCGRVPLPRNRLVAKGKLRTEHTAVVANGIDRIESDPAIGYTLHNVVSSCFPCNRGKQAMNQADFITHIVRIRSWLSHA